MFVFVFAFASVFFIVSAFVFLHVFEFVFMSVSVIVFLNVFAFIFVFVFVQGSSEDYSWCSLFNGELETHSM